MTLKPYRTAKVLTLRSPTIVGLTESQADARRHALEPTGDKGVFKVAGEIQFKAGEMISLDENLPKGLAAFVEDPSAPPASAASAAVVDVVELQRENAELHAAVQRAAGERDAALADVAGLQAEREFVGTLLSDDQRAAIVKWAEDRKAEAGKAAADPSLFQPPAKPPARPKGK